MMRPSLSLIAVACLAILTPAVRAQVVAKDTQTPSYVQFSAPHFEVSETETNAVLTVVRSGDFRNSSSVAYKTLEGTAESNVDFESTGGDLTFNPGECFKTITIPVLRNGKPAPDKTFKVALAQPSPDTIVLTAAADVSIKAAGPALSIALAADGLTVQWPDVGATCTLEAQVDGNWTAVTERPTLVDGSWAVKVNPSQTVALFRLRLE
jgi:hypothetical protein